MIQFEWDNNKNLLNVRKHGISFETASHVFDDPSMLSWIDTRHSYDEERWIGLGAINHEVIILIIHTVKVTDYDEEIIRIISARKANNKERTHYFTYYKKKQK